MTVLRKVILPWDSDWFGLRVGRADVSVLTAAAAGEVEFWAEAERLACVYVLACERASHEVSGFARMDERVEYQFDALAPAGGACGNVGPMRDVELDSVCALARAVTTGTRFLSDPRFPRERVREMYAEWVRRDWASETPVCLVAREAGTVIGFVTGRVANGCGEIGLVGVAEEHRGQGWGRALLLTALTAFAASGATRVHVVTQASNAAASSLYVRCGARVFSRRFWYHHWSVRPGSEPNT